MFETNIAELGEVLARPGGPMLFKPRAFEQ
jgi:hypothetical protein